MSAPTPAPSPPLPPVKDEVTVISHSNVFYWWPVWLLGFIFGVWTLVDGHVMALIPEGSDSDPIVVVHDATIETQAAGEEQKLKGREAIIAPKSKTLPRPADNSKGPPSKPKLHMARTKGLGVIFCVTLLVVVLVTNLPLRGIVAVLVIIGVIMLVVILILAGVWETISRRLVLLDIRINAGGYFFISGVLFGIWLLALLVIDRYTYIVFTKREFRVASLGGREQVYSAVGMAWQDDRGFVRHWIPGLRLVGDLVVRTAGAQAHHFDLPNVLFIGRVVKELRQLQPGA